MSVHKDPLVSIIGDELRARLLRVFVFENERIFIPKEMQKIIKKSLADVQSELKYLEKDGIIIKKKLTKSQKEEKECRESSGYVYNLKYSHRDFLEKIVKESTPSETEVLIKKITKIPGVCILITTGIFNNKKKSDVDMVIASNKENEKLLRDKIQEVEKEIGRELKCSLLSVNDFVFRMQTRDKFLREIFDGDYMVCLDKVGIFDIPDDEL